jgi:hypothetical protein
MEIINNPSQNNIKKTANINEYMKEYMRIYRLEKKDILPIKRHEYYLNNKSKWISQNKKYIKRDRSEYFKVYRESHQDKIKQNCNKYYQLHKNDIRECPVCKCMIKGIGFTNHNKTNKHKNNLVRLSSDNNKSSVVPCEINN